MRSEPRGRTEQAALVDDLVAAVRSYQEVAEGGGDTQAATEQLLDALGGRRLVLTHPASTRGPRVPVAWAPWWSSGASSVCGRPPS